MPVCARPLGSMDKKVGFAGQTGLPASLLLPAFSASMSSLPLLLCPESPQLARIQDVAIRCQCRQNQLFVLSLHVFKIRLVFMSITTSLRGCQGTRLPSWDPDLIRE